MQLILTIPNSESEELMATLIREILEGQVRVNEILLKGTSLAPLYDSGVRFQQETASGAVCPDIVTLYQRGYGNCAPLACARAAELRNQGVRAGIKVYWRPDRNPLPFHVEVRLPNGKVEDPSRRLGMVGAGFE